jgi:CRP/FNR family cyclic AMP-dependent transcriptional regulator
MTHPLFSRNHLFHRLPEALAVQLYDAGEIHQEPAGSVIISEGEPLKGLYVLLSGKVEAVLPEGLSRVAPVKLAELGAGDCFGDYAFIDNQPASASIRAVEPCEFYLIPYDALKSFLDRHPTVAAVIYRNLLQIFVRRLRASNAELDLFSTPLESEF